MNSYKLNGIAGHMFRQMICKQLCINHTDLYKTVKSIHMDGTITLHDGRTFIPVLLETTNK